MVDETNKPASLFLYMIFLRRAPLFLGKKGAPVGNLGKKGQPGIQTPPAPSTAAKISFFDQINFREIRKAAPPGTLGFPPKISRLVRLDGATDVTRTHDRWLSVRIHDGSVLFLLSKL